MRVEIYGAAKQNTVTGNTVRFTADDAAPVDSLTAQIAPSAGGDESVTISANGQDTTVSFGEAVYGGSVNVTSGIVTETYGGGAYDPANVPADLAAIVDANTTAETASGAIASFDCELGEYPLKSLTAQITPVQDLHGYDNPWPAGGGKNLLNYASAIVNPTIARFENIQFSAQTYTISYFGSTNVRIIVYDHASGTTLATSSYTKVYQFTPTEAVAVDIAFYDSGGVTAAENLFQCEVGSTSTPFAPYSNICPISGWTGADVFRTGVNVWDEEWESGYYYNNSTGVKESTPNWNCSKNLCSCVGGATYYCTCNSISNWFGSLLWYDAGKNFILRSNWQYSREISAPQNAAFFAFNISISQYGGTTYNNDISINYPSTDHDYHAYSGVTVSLTWQNEAGTVYGGNVTYLGGGNWRLTSSMAMVDLGTLAWSVVNSHCFYTGAIAAIKSNTIASAIPNIVCSNYKAVSASQSYNGSAGNGVSIGINGLIGEKRIAIYDTAYSDAAAFKTAMSGVQLCYELATPLTYTLTTEQLTTLLGQNNVWANTGEISVEYRYGQLSSIPVITDATALETGALITYPLSMPNTFSITPTTISTVAGDNVMSASTGQISVTWSSHWLDITPYIAWQGLTFSRNDVDAPDAGRDMSGLMHRGRVAVKEKMNITTVTMTQAQSAALQTLLYPESIQVRVNPYPRTNASHTMTMYTNNVKTTHVVTTRGGDELQSLSFPLIEL